MLYFEKNRIQFLNLIISGIPAFFAPEAILTYGYYLAVTPLLWSFLVYERRNVIVCIYSSIMHTSERVVAKLGRWANRMSMTTTQMHRVMIQIQVARSHFANYFIKFHQVLIQHGLIPFIVFFGC